MNASDFQIVLRALSFARDSSGDLRSLPESRWAALLKRLDEEHLTLTVGTRCREHLPGFVRHRIDRDLANNAERHRALLSAYREIASAFDRSSIPFAVLKGFTHWPDYCDSLPARPQYDLDLFCPEPHVMAAQSEALPLGYEALPNRGKQPTDHLPTLIRKTGWRWRGDYFDPLMPPALELHFRFWDAHTEQIALGDLDQFWTRRTSRVISGTEMPMLSRADGLSYATLHLLRHLLRGDLRIYHVYELAHLLEHTANDEALWTAWVELNSKASQSLQAIAFRLSAEWFDCRSHPFATHAMEQLSGPVRKWFELFSLSPIDAGERPNKDELLLHLALASDAQARRRIAIRRVLPLQLNRVTLEPHVDRPTLSLRIRRSRYQLRAVITRTIHHARTLVPLLMSLYRWWAYRPLPATLRISRADIAPE